VTELSLSHIIKGKILGDIEIDTKIDIEIFVFEFLMGQCWRHFIFFSFLNFILFQLDCKFFFFISNQVESDQFDFFKN
jgi:hypothetical protein